ncbi:acyltransferase [Sphingomonas ginsenosidivorax]|uniref:Acyltransferase n=1 Tax=Sphingomonas ginsenosidivorax TaxID=862135 RepID=A0A5C6UFV2_9SPHN|nr:acyltransferase family protein [Sphingomonas ginsenosidivorax]TXC70915.1 acyltransferase [Sphingomonas ginsenosidivorax]
MTTGSHRALPYRGDIDGLRAIAVTAVVAFHAGISGVSGGFAGVDVFFVISGYLIGGIVDREIGEGRFGFAAFYARRARRIVPALIATALGTVALGLVLLGPGELEALAISVTAALLGVSNLWFVHSTDYFVPDARLAPFLMTWSLGIEEQFYLLLPPVLLLLRRSAARTRLGATLALVAVSLAISVIATPLRPVEAFYLLPTRAWELGFGVALAMAHAAGYRVPGRLQPWLSATGLCAIVASVTLFDEHVRFPGHAALLPTLGTVALLAAPDSGLNRRLLASRPLVAIGLISYSWYLLHWPLLALLRVAAAGPVPPALPILVGFGSILPAWLCWRWIERPFRRPASGSDRRTVRRYAATLALCSLAFGGIALSGGIPARVGPSGARVEAMLDAGRGNPCLAGYGTDRPNLSPACAPRGDAPLIALLGDSHASALGDALRERVARHGYGVLQMTAASCPPLLGATLRMTEHPGASRACAAFNTAAITRAASDPRVKLVVLTAFWQSPFSTRAQVMGDGLVDTDPAGRARTNADELRIALTRTLVTLRRAGKSVLVLGDVPWIGFDPALHAWSGVLPARRAIERRVSPALGSDGTAPRALVSPLDDDASRIVAASATAVPGVRHVALRAILCDAQRCRTGDDDMPFYIDTQHLSRAGADFVLARIPALP